MAGAALLICIAAALLPAQEPAQSEARSWVDHLFDAERALHEGRPVDALEHLNEVPDENPALHYGMACLVARMGHPEAHILQHLERAVERGWSDAAVARWEPAFARLEFDPRFVALLEAMGRSERLPIVGLVGLPGDCSDSETWPDAGQPSDDEHARARLQRFDFEVSPTAYRFSPNGTRLAVAFGVSVESIEPLDERTLTDEPLASIGGEVRVLDVETGEELWRQRTNFGLGLFQRQHPEAIHWAPDGGRVAVEFSWQSGVAVWDAESGELLVHSSSTQGGERRCAWLDSHRFAVLGAPGYVFDSTGAVRRSYWPFDPGGGEAILDSGPLGTLRRLASGHVDAPRGSTLLRYSEHEARRPRILTTQLDVAYRLLDPFVVRAVDAGVAVAPALVADPRDRSSAPPPTAVALYDGHEALSRLEASWGAAPAKQQRAAHARADAALEAWISGERSRAVEEWTRLRLELEGRRAPWDVGLASLRLEFVEGGATGRVLRRLWSNGPNTGSTRVRVAQRFPVPELAGAQRTGRIEFVDLVHGVRPEWSARLTLAFDDTGSLVPCSVELGLPGAAPWTYEIRARVRGTDWDHIAAVNVDPDYQRGRLVGPLGADSSAASRAARARAALRQNLPSLENSTSFLSEPMRDSRVELVSVPGAWPMHEYPGMHFAPEDAAWIMTRRVPTSRTFVHGDRDLALWVAQPTTDEPRPAVIALHGEGFDEGWFAHLAGGGALFTEGPERGVVVAAPRTHDIADQPGALDSLIDDLVAFCKVDRERVYLLGHGSGGEVAQKQFDPEVVAGVACLASGSLEGGADTLYLVGEHEQLPADSGAAVDVVRVPGAGRVLGLERSIAAALDHWGLR